MFVTTCSPLARNIIRGVFRAHPNAVGLTTHDIYESALTLYPNAKSGVQLPTFGDAPVKTRRKGWELPPQPENPDHPIRSMRYLKKIVLEHMASQGEISKAHSVKVTDEDGNSHIRPRVKGEQAPITSHYQQRYRITDRATSVWVWRHVDPKRLHLEENVSAAHTSQVNMKKDFDMPEDEIEWDRSIKFVDEPIPQERNTREGRPSGGFGVVTGNQRREDRPIPKEPRPQQRQTSERFGVVTENQQGERNHD